MTPSSIDPAEVAFYERLSSLWWQAEGPFWPLHRMNALRTAYIRDRLIEHFGGDAGRDAPLHGLRILDIGCGGGILSEAVARLGADVHGVDVVEKNIHVARLHAELSGLPIHYETASAEILAGRGDSYDAVLNMEVVEHVAELDVFMSACLRLVKPGGLIFVATLNRTLASWLGAIVMAEYVLRWLPRGTHQWGRFPKPVELENILEQSGLKVIDRTGVGVHPWGLKFHFSRYMGINYILTAARP
ncbi:bifunctional 2-polyprenyl-6-hydroxyphenol methylase/3-demethylubiquinol 3-O-methyltransferase UbiG [Methylococcus sp. EFPC2]|uniref:bifunctional 2-polyprenyl-6-hydroxyphenol methylase/3-demethylubiquinol 3-O-methyltransferase UbiG n=1 Tax=Methylococcus sp. EFPC2 TaxID=2812648 RepID=UPI001966DE2C|nr:bifunctional 2-polyprenyl-6-hydroxyphenol methylase/3-demethylubiquinol 3-O-methyltransferase UbiG [Methylococcus sp. EFPC2]QSA97968.1 bifunctional 2-polyprenyl-6-hydroxyphenol methylase/3-demethylubiquinol 3-O-methyltransferase UbiG [Methylococcus sp. EFPC2]